MGMAQEYIPIMCLQSNAHNTRSHHFIQRNLQGQRCDASLMIYANNLISWYQTECRHSKKKKKGASYQSCQHTAQVDKF